MDGREPALVDAGTGAAAHLAALDDALGGRPLARVLVTHGHSDHASGVPALRQRWPQLVACKRTLPGESGWQPLADGDRVPAGDDELVVIETPGHAADHVSFWHEPSRTLFAGDMVIEGTTVMIPAGRGGSLRQYLASLDRLLGLRPDRIYPGHGPIIDEPARLITRYIERRLARERQIAALVADGLTDADALVSRIYPSIAEAVRPAARATIQAHLDKLREDQEQG
jgi:glyoxylase-like metal-dependent hydrolase (beta-lactamase superfamily II)